jgi:hypothetical protein
LRAADKLCPVAPLNELSYTALVLCLDSIRTASQFRNPAIHGLSQFGNIQPAESITAWMAALAIFLRGRTMASDHNRRADDDPDYSFGVSELRLRQAELRQVEAPQPLALDPVPKKTSYNEQGSDPYNSTGTFDLTGTWMRVRKR